MTTSAQVASGGAALPQPQASGRSGLPDGRYPLRQAGDGVPKARAERLQRAPDRRGVVGEPADDEHRRDAGGAAPDVRPLAQLARKLKPILGVRPEVDAGRERAGPGEPERGLQQRARIARQAPASGSRSEPVGRAGSRVVVGWVAAAYHAHRAPL